MTGKKDQLTEIELEVTKYSKYLYKLVKDLKKRNYPLDKIYFHKPILRWFPYRRWYHVGIDDKILEEIDWNTFVFAVYYDLKKTSFVKTIKQKINELRKNNKEESIFENWLLKTLFVFFNEESDNFLNRKKLVKYLISAINNEPPIVQTTSLLAGIMLDCDEIKISKELKIRKATKQDLEFKIKVGDDKHDYERAIEESFSILHYTYRKKERWQYSFEVLPKIELILQLFKLSSVNCTGTIERTSEISFESHGTYRRGFYPKRGIVYYAKIKKDEIPYLQRFYKIMNKRLTRQMVNHYFEQDEKEIALSRYVKGLEWIHNTESSVSYAVMAIEALLIKSEGDQKLRFALRTSKLLGLIGLNSERVYGNMLLAYDVRSKYVHGDKMSNKTEKSIKQNFTNKEKFAFTIMDYARLIIVIFLILNKSKDTLYKMLETAQFPKGEINMKRELKPIFRYMKLGNYNPKFRHFAIHKAEYVTE